MFSWLQQSGESEEMRSEGHDVEYKAADFGKLLFLTLVSSCISSTDILCSLSPTNEDIEMAGESPTATTTAEEAAAGKGPDVIVTIGGAAAGMPSHGRVFSLTVHDAHHSKEPPGMTYLCYSCK